MNETNAVPDYRRHRFPPTIIGHAVWLYCRFHLMGDVQDLLAEGGLIVSHESIRQWCDTFGRSFAAGLRQGGRSLATSSTATRCC